MRQARPLAEPDENPLVALLVFVLLLVALPALVYLLGMATQP